MCVCEFVFGILLIPKTSQNNVLRPFSYETGHTVLINTHAMSQKNNNKRIKKVWGSPPKLSNIIKGRVLQQAHDVERGASMST